MGIVAVISEKDLSYDWLSNGPKNDSVYKKISSSLSEITTRQIAQWLMCNIAVEEIFQNQTQQTEEARREITQIHIPRLIYHMVWNLAGGRCIEGDFSPHGKNYQVDLSQISYSIDTQISLQSPGTEIIFMWLWGPMNSNRPYFMVQSSIVKPSQLSKIMDVVKEQRHECRPFYDLHIINSSQGGFASYSYIALILLSPVKGNEDSGNYSLTIIPLHSEKCPHAV